MKNLLAKVFLSVTIAFSCFTVLFADTNLHANQTHIHVVTAIYEPFVMYKDGKLTGFDIDLLNEICKQHNITYTITVTNFQDMLARVASGSADMAVGCIYVTGERRILFNYSEPYIEGGLVLVVTADSAIQNIYQLQNKKIGVKRGATGEAFALRKLQQYNITIVRFDNTIESFNALVNGSIDAVLNDYLNSVYLLNKYYSGSIKITKGIWGDIVYDRTDVAFPVTAHNTKLLEIVSDSISDLKSKKFIDMLYWKWFAVIPPPNKTKQVALYLGATIIIILTTLMVLTLLTRKKRIIQLQKIESYFRNLIYDLHVGVYILQKNKVVLTNFEGARIAGTTVENMIGHIPDEFFSEYTISAENTVSFMSFADLDKLFTTNRMVYGGIWKRKDGTVLNVLFRIRPVQWMGENAIECVVSDITDFAQLQLQKEELKGQLFQSQKMEIIGQIAGGIAHDFNNILTVILGYANLLEKSVAQKDVFALRKIIEASNHAKDIVSKLLTFARKKAPQFNDIHVHGIIYNSIGLLQPSISKKCNVQLSLQAYDDVVPGDATLLQQVIMNLVINAVDAIPSTGTITIGTENVRIAQNRPGRVEILPQGDYLLLTVKDTGIGIAEEDIEHIFEPLFTKKEKGSGLGLAIVYGIVKQHRGYIDVDSTLNAGTTFFIYFPVIKTQQTIEEQTDTSHKLQIAEAQFVIIDDDENICSLYKEALALGGLNAVTFTDPVEALDYIDLHNKSIQVVISDVRMPVLPGEEVLKKIKQKYPYVKVVMMTGYYDDALKQELLLSGAYEVWEKMYDIQQIISKAKGAIKHNGR